jgi:DNA-directed RNA polymerase beta' subunit
MSIVPETKILYLEFSPNDDTSIKESSVATLHSELTSDKANSGIFDSRFGAGNNYDECTTCHSNDPKKCLGHSGNMSLSRPMINSLGLRPVKQWLKIICFRCGRPIVDMNDIRMYPVAARLKKAEDFVAHKRKDETPCQLCKECINLIPLDKRPRLVACTSDPLTGLQIQYGNKTFAPLRPNINKTF